MHWQITQFLWILMFCLFSLFKISISNFHVIDKTYIHLYPHHDCFECMLYVCIGLEDAEEEEDPDYKKDPIYQIDLQVIMTYVGFIYKWYHILYHYSEHSWHIPVLQTLQYNYGMFFFYCICQCDTHEFVHVIQKTSVWSKHL